MNSYYKNLFNKLFKSFSFIFPLFILVFIFIFCFCVVNFTNTSNISINLENSFITPCKNHIFGTNEYGQDVFTLLCISVYNTLKLAALVTLANLIVGAILGIIWGSSSKADAPMIAIKGLLDNIPSIFFYLIIFSVFGNNFIPLLLLIVIFNCFDLSCLIRNNLLLTRNKDYNKISKLLKTSKIKIAINNHLPSLLPIIFNSIATSFINVISLEITLSYFGLKILPKATLGQLLYSSIYNNHFFSYSYLLLIPLTILIIINLCFFYLGKSVSSIANKEE